MNKVCYIVVLCALLVSCKSTSQVSSTQKVEAIKIEAIGTKPTLERQPYLQMVKANSAIITWKTDASVTECLVIYSEIGGDTVFIEKGYLTAHEGYLFNEVALKNLEPDTKYTYAIHSNGHVLARGENYYFKTSPDNKKQAFSFYAMGDIGAKEKSSFANEPADRIAEMERKPDFGLGLGDIVYPKGESKNYDNHLFKPFKDVFINTPFYPVAGNHDWLSANHDENFKKEWNLPNEEYYYSFAYSNTLFIGLDSRDGSFYDYEKQTLWLKETLKQNAGKHDWIVVYLHHNGKSCTYKKDYEHVMGLYEVFAANKVDIVLNGHAHTYERLKPYNGNGMVEQDRTNQSEYKDLENRFISITMGAGGKLNKKWKADPSNKENCEDGTIVAHSEHMASFGVFEVDGKTLSFKGYNSYTGKSFDEFVIEK